MSSGIYENLPLKSIDNNKGEVKDESVAKETDLESYTSPIKTLQKTIHHHHQPEPQFLVGIVPKNRKRPPKSITHIFLRSKKRAKKLNDELAYGKKAGDDAAGRKSFENGKETDVADGKEAVLSSKGEDDDGSERKEVQSRTSTCQRSTPTSTLDDGYESCNSTPQGGQQRLIRQQSSPSSTLGFTQNLIPKNLQVQVEEDERGFESLLASSSSSQAEADPDSPREEGGDDRETWASNADFLLSIIGFAVDLANVWRFPYLCYKNGGGAFLIPYILMLVFGAVPLFYMELILGQFSRQGPVSVWRICPLFKGVGFCAVLVAFYVSFYYNVIIAWSLYFLASSIKVELPWLHCNNVWNTDLCWESMLPESKNNQTAVPTINMSTLSIVNMHTPASEFFHRAVLEMQWSDGLHAMGYPKWQLVLCLLIVYTMLYISLFKGVKSSGKVVWVTATMPYVVLSILLVRGLMLPGAVKGITYYLKPELSKLREAQVWVDAAVQIFYSVGAGFGVHLSYASYNTFHNNCFRDCIVTTIVNSFTSFFSGFVIFTYLGFMSHKQGVPISTVATEGPGLVFQVYPEAVATLPGSHLWSMLFFFMLIMLGLDSAMGGLECVITGLMDEFSWFFKGRHHSREFFTLGVIILSFSVALINVTPGGIYMFHLFDTYSAGISLLCSALFEAIAVSWFYGLDKFSQDAYAMLGRRPGCYWRICWKIISPSFIIGVVIFGLLYHEPLQYNDYLYPSWAEWVGCSLALSSILMIPLVAIIQIIKTPGTFKEKLAISISPEEEHEHLRESKLVSRFKAKHWFFV